MNQKSRKAAKLLREYADLIERDGLQNISYDACSGIYEMLRRQTTDDIKNCAWDLAQEKRLNAGNS